MDFGNMNLKARFWNYAQLVTGNTYIVDDENKDALARIIEVMQKGEKGIVLCGKTGSGKTFIFQLLQKILHPRFHPKVMAIKHVSEVVAMYEKKGDEGLFSLQNNSICFDELGREKNAKYFGSESDVMEMLIGWRYTQWKFLDKLTFFTSNYSREDLCKRYGTHSDSRLNEMCEFINLGTASNHADRRLKAARLAIGMPDVMPMYKKTVQEPADPNQKKINKEGFEKIAQMLADKMKGGSDADGD